MAALEAFQSAFPLPHLPATYGRECNDHPLSEQVALLIKTFPPQGFSAEWHWLQARAAEDSRIVLIAESLPRDELLALYCCCDVFLSLLRRQHRLLLRAARPSLRRWPPLGGTGSGACGGALSCGGGADRSPVGL